MGAIANTILIGLYVGKLKKPDTIDEFMKYFVDELKHLNGVIKIPAPGPDDSIVEIEVNFAISLFVTDTPARCFLISTRYHTHTYACQRCDQRTVKKNMQRTSGNLRTNVSFTERLQPEQHSIDHYTVDQKSILEAHGFKPIDQFPLDVMHLMDLGVGKLILTALVKRKLIRSPPKNHIECIKSHYALYASYCPTEFARIPRQLNDLGKFKATEFRQFFLYTGIVFMEDFVDAVTYKHFLMASLGYRIILSENYNENIVWPLRRNSLSFLF